MILCVTHKVEWMKNYGKHITEMNLFITSDLWNNTKYSNFLTGASGLVNTLSSSFFSLGVTGTHSLSAMKINLFTYCQ